MFFRTPLLAFIIASLASVSLQHDHHDEEQLPLGFNRFPYQAAYSDDFFSDEVTAYSTFSGITTFAKLPWVECLTKGKDTTFDIAFLGAPFVSHTAIFVFDYTTLIRFLRIPERLTGQVLALAQRAFAQVLDVLRCTVAITCPLRLILSRPVSRSWIVATSL